MKSFFACFLLIFLSGNSYGVDRCVDGNLCSVTIVHLISNPELYHKKEVIVRGYFVSYADGANLYLDTEKAKYGLVEYSIGLEFPEVYKKESIEKSGSYILIQGVFNKNNRGGGVPSAGSVAVTRFGVP